MVELDRCMICNCHENWCRCVSGFKPKPKYDAVDHPSHYTSHPSGIEAIEVTRHYNFAIGNAIKYLWRAGLKEDAKIQDLKKAIWYIEDEIKRLTNG